MKLVTLAFLSAAVLLLSTTACQEDRRYAGSSHTSVDGDDASNAPAEDDAPAAPVDDNTQIPQASCDTYPDDDWVRSEWVACGPVSLSGDRYQRSPLLVWAGDRFAAIWVENRQGRLFASVAFVDPYTLEVSVPIVLHDLVELERQPDSIQAVWTGESLVVAWGSEEGIWATSVNPEPGVVGAPRQIIANTGTHISLKAVRVLPDGGLAAIWLDDRDAEYEYSLWFAPFTLDSQPSIEHQRLTPRGSRVDVGSISHGASDPCDCNDRWLFSFTFKLQNGPMESDDLVLARFDQDGSLVQQEVIYTGDTLQLPFHGESVVETYAGTAVGLLDVDEGAQIVWVNDAGETTRTLLVPRGDRPNIAFGPGPGWFGAVVDAGSLLVEGDGVAFLPMFPGEEPTTVPLLLPGSLNATANDYTIAAGGGGFGVLIEDERQVYFTFLVNK